jgi:outer membrane receptor for ferrienterochelin and colicins
MIFYQTFPRAVVFCVAALCGPLFAQPRANLTGTSDAPAAADPPATDPPKEGGKRAGPTSPSVTLKPVEIRASNETESRRLSTAAKIIVGRDDIELYGDDTMGELLKRLPGITVQGRPGRGGAPRMRGLGNGYTQILIDGERVPRGFSLDDLSPDQIERIEILRAPTAETGARAIAGTINIITRGGYTKHVNDLKVGLGLKNGHVAPGASWSRNDTDGDLIYNFSIAATRSEASNDLLNETLTENLADGSVIHQLEAVSSNGTHDGIHANARLQWRGAGADSITLTPMVAATQNSGTRNTRLTQTASGTDFALPYDSSIGTLDSRFNTVRLAGIWVHRMEDGATLRMSASAGQSAWFNDSSRQNLSDSRGAIAVATQQSEQHDTTLNATAKYSTTIAEEHSLVTGFELGSNQRRESATTLLNGDSPLSDYDGNLTASSIRAALYAQDEWALDPHWSAHAGLRWEGIATSGSVSADAPDASNTSRVLSPLFHVVWRPDLLVKDQVRFSLTRSYRSPNLQDLIARPTINSMFLNRGANDEVHPDRAGNPYLQPELASGLDIAYEHYVPGGGLLSANVFFRQIQNLMRSQTTLETVSWADVPRWVARKQNIGNATTQGIELEAKFRISEMFEQAPKVDLRANLSLFRSSVEGISSPNNRLDQQPDGTANIGADYQLRSLPLKVGGNINWTPSFTTRLGDDQTVFQNNKFVADTYLLWTISPTLQLRVSLSNFAGRDYVTGGSLLSTNPQGQAVRESTQSIAPSFVNMQVRLEIKL